MNGNMIEIRSLHKAYGGNVAVDDLSFAVAAGETFGLLGPNGAGKSTTISMMVGVVSPDSGTVRLTAEGLDPLSTEGRRLLGVVPQSLSLYEHMSAMENLDFFGRLYSLSGLALKQRTQWALEFAGLTDRRDDRVQTYSGGMKRRLNLVCALIHDPQIILMDEPTVGVDPQSRHHLFENIEALRRDGRTIVYTTHYMEEAQRLCDRIAIMDHGRLLALDSVDGLIAAHGGASLVMAQLQKHPADQGIADGDLPGEVDEDLMLRFQTTDALREMSRLLQRGVKFKTWKVSDPDLEAVFLSLTGRTLRD